MRRQPSGPRRPEDPMKKLRRRYERIRVMFRDRNGNVQGGPGWKTFLAQQRFAGRLR